jgi:O-antigen ligase
MSSAITVSPARTTPLSLRAGVVCGAALTFGVVSFNEAVFRNNDVEEFSADWQVAARLLICAACGLYGVYYLPQTFASLWRFPGVLSVLFGLWALVTVPFAYDPKYSAASAGALWCVILFAPAALSQLGPRGFVMTTILSLGIFIAGSWLMYYVAPDVGRTVQTITGGEQVSRLGGLTHPNALGRIAAVFIALLFLAAARYGFRWGWLIPLAAIAAFTIDQADSRTGMIAAAVGTVVALRGKLSPLLRPGALSSLLAVGAALLLLVVAADMVDFNLDKALAGIARNGDAEEIYSLTGRTEVWQFAAGNIARSPLFGFGYGCSRFVMMHNFFATHHAHNLLLNVGLNAGLVGMLLVFWMLAVLLWRAAAAPSGFPDVIAVLVLVAGLADFVMLGPIPDSHTLLFFVALHWACLADSKSAAAVDASLAPVGLQP